MSYDKNEIGSKDRLATNENESDSQKHQNPFDGGKDAISEEEISKEQEFKEAQTERD